MGDWVMSEELSSAMGLGDDSGVAAVGGSGMASPRAGINKSGFIDNSDGATLRSGPAELGGVAAHSSPLPPATRVFVSGTHPAATQWWYVTAFLPGEIVRGYVQNFRVTTDLPEPLAKLHQVKAGDTAHRLAQREFSSAVTDGQDLRFYENVLLKVNREHGRAGVIGSFQSPGVFGGGDNNVQLVAGHRIWLVSPAYAQSLEGEVPDGSLTNGVYAKARRFAAHLADIVKSVTQSPQFLAEVAGEYAQVLADHIIEIVGIVAGFIAAEALSAFLASTPTGVGQIVAVLIQLALAAFGAHGMVEAGAQAMQHGSRWLNLAWTASGKDETLDEASKEFLKMLVAIAMAALAFAGVKGNVGKSLKIADSLPMPMPALALAGGGQLGSSGAGTAAAIGGPGPMSGIGAAGSQMSKLEGEEGPSRRGEIEEGAEALASYSDEALDAWGARIKSQGIKGDIDKILVRAKGKGPDAIAARGELRAAERAHRRGDSVEMLTPPEGAGAIQGKKTPEAKLASAERGERGLEVKTATAPPDRQTWNAHADKANKQIKSLGKPGEISFDWTEVDLRRGGDFKTSADVESFLNGKMTKERLREVRYFEIVWKDADGVVRTTSRARNVDGTLGEVVTKP